LKQIVLETAALKVKKSEQCKGLKEKTNMLDHKRKLQAIEFVASTRQKGKESEVKRKHEAKKHKMQEDPTLWESSTVSSASR
jgi:hypothetical protein